MGLGVALASLVLTVPGLFILSAGVFVAVCWNLRGDRCRLATLVAGVLLPLVPWQIHCVSLTGQIQPLLVDVSRTYSGGFTNWNRTWILRERDLYAWRDGGKSLTQLADDVFSSPEQRLELVRAQRLRHEDLIGDDQHDSTFQRAADFCRTEHPARYYIGMPVLRAFYLWTDMPSLGHFDVGYIDRLSQLSFYENRSTHGTVVASLRWAKGLASLLVYVLFLLYPIAFIALTLFALRARQLLPTAIVLGTLAYTFASAILVFGETRRNLPLFPFLLFLLFFVGSRGETTV